MFIRMSLLLIYYGVIYQILLYILNISISFVIHHKQTLSSPFLLKISNTTSKLNHKCKEIDKKIQENIVKY